jgi:hypothetical protein
LSKGKEENQMVELAAEHNVYGTGRPYCARLTGLDPKYGFAREFLPAVERRRSRSGATGANYYQVDEPGIYEVQSAGRKGVPERAYYRVVAEGGQLKAYRISVSEARDLLR